MRKFLAVAVVLAAMFAFIGCSSKDKSSDTEPTEETTITTTESPIKTVEDALESDREDFEFRAIDDVIKINVPVQMTMTTQETGHYCMLGDLGKFGTTTLIYSYTKNFDSKEITPDDAFDSQSKIQFNDLRDIMLNTVSLDSHIDNTEDFSFNKNKFKVATGHIDVSPINDEQYFAESFTMYFASCYGVLNDEENNINNLPIMWSLYTNNDCNIKDLLDEINKTAELNITDQVKFNFSLNEDGNVIDPVIETETTTDTTVTETETETTTTTTKK